MVILGLAWWLFAIELAFVFATLFSVGHRRPFLGGFFTFAAFGAWWVFSGFPNVIEMVVNNGQVILFWSAVYLLVGFAWGVVNWLIYTRSEDMRGATREAYANYSHHNSDATIEGFKSSHYYPYGFNQDFPFIANSIIWWPLSMIWTVLDDFLLNVVTFLGRQFSGFFGSIASGSVKSALKDVDTSAKSAKL